LMLSAMAWSPRTIIRAIPEPRAGSSRSIGATKVEAVSVPVLLIPPSNVTSAAENTVASKSSKTPAADTAPSLMKANCCVASSTETMPMAIGVPLPLIAIAGAGPNWSMSLVAVVVEVTCLQY